MKPIQNGSNPNWRTPAALLESLRDEYGPLYDPCPPHPTEDGLKARWPSNRPAFVNPPYTRGIISQWVVKCFEQWRINGQTVILLIPAYTDTAYFHDWILPYAEIRFIRGRLKFDDGGKPAPFPSLLCIFKGGSYSMDLSRSWGVLDG